MAGAGASGGIYGEGNKGEAQGPSVAGRGAFPAFPGPSEESAHVCTWSYFCVKSVKDSLIL